MAKASPGITSFNAGEWSPLTFGRIDQERYFDACAYLRNMIPQIQGPAVKRSGTRFVREVKDSADLHRLIPFQFSIAQSYQLQLGDGYMWFYTQNGVIETSPGVPYEISTPYAAADLAEIQYAQSADVMYLVHPDYPVQKLSRFGNTNWTLAEAIFGWPPFLDENITATTVQLSNVNGSGTATASTGIFNANLVGSYITLREIVGANHDEWEVGESITAGSERRFDGNVYRAQTTGTTGTRPPVHTEGTESDGAVNWLWIHDGAGYARITGIVSSTVANIDIEARFPASVVSDPTVRWSLGAFSAQSGYPRAITFYEDRLLLAGTTTEPQTIRGSQSGDYQNFKTGVNDSDSYRYTINTDQVNTIQWMSPGKVLLIGTLGGEFAMRASSLEEAITPTNVRVVEETRLGSQSIAPVRISNATLFVQRSGRKLRESKYDFDTDSYVARDLTLLSEHLPIEAQGITSLAYQSQPTQIVWMTTTRGQLLALTYEQYENVYGWHPHEISGTEVAVESVSVIPHPDGDQDQVWLIVRRIIDGQIKRYVEYMEKPFKTGDDVTDAFFMDSGLSYDGPAVNSVTGLDHLEGQTVDILADGAVHPIRVVSAGGVALDNPASKVSVGLNYTAGIAPMRLEAGATDGTAQSKTKRITDVAFRLLNTGSGLFYGPSLDTMDEMSFRTPFMDMDAPVPLFTGDKGPLSWPGGYEQDAYIYLQHRLPLPFSLIAIMPQLVTQDR